MESLMEETTTTKEGRVAREIESRTAKLPSDLFLWAAVGSIAASLVLRLMDRREDAIFVGEWAPTFLVLGLYNKLVKIAGHDQESGLETEETEVFGGEAAY